LCDFQGRRAECGFPHHPAALQFGSHSPLGPFFHLHRRRKNARAVDGDGRMGTGFRIGEKKAQKKISLELGVFGRRWSLPFWFAINVVV
jgi:hypothetical protein